MMTDNAANLILRVSPEVKKDFGGLPSPWLQTSIQVSCQHHVPTPELFVLMFFSFQRTFWLRT